MAGIILKGTERLPALLAANTKGPNQEHVVRLHSRDCFAAFMRDASRDLAGARVTDAAKLSVEKEGRPILDIYIAEVSNFGSTHFAAVATQPLESSPLTTHYVSREPVSDIKISFGNRLHEEFLIEVSYHQEDGIPHSDDGPTSLLRFPTNSVLGFIRFSTEPHSNVTSAALFGSLGSGPQILEAVAKILTNMKLRDAASALDIGVDARVLQSFAVL